MNTVVKSPFLATLYVDKSWLVLSPARADALARGFYPGTLQTMTCGFAITSPALARVATVFLGLLLFLPAPAVSHAEQTPAQLKGTTAPAPTSPAKKSKSAKLNTPGADTGAAATPAEKSISTEQAIVALVNDEPVTGYEIQQRALLAGGAGIGKQAQENFQALIKNPKTSERLKAILGEVIKANEGKSREQIIAIFEQKKKEFGASLQKQAVESARASALPGAKKAALDELIDEKLKLQEAKRQNIQVPEEEVNRVIASIAERNKVSQEQLAQQLGGNMEPMKARVRSTLSWNEVVRRQYGSQITVTSHDVDKFMASNTSGAQDDVELQVQRIRIAVPVKIDQSGVAQRMQQAEELRSKFKDCKSMNAIAAGVPGANYEDLGKQKPAQFQEPTRTLLLNAKDGEMLPPSVGSGGIELYAVCGREVVKAENQKRQQAEGELKQREFELLAKRKLKDLRQDAHIEYR